MLTNLCTHEHTDYEVVDYIMRMAVMYDDDDVKPILQGCQCQIMTKFISSDWAAILPYTAASGKNLIFTRTHFLVCCCVPSQLFHSTHYFFKTFNS